MGVAGPKDAPGGALGSSDSYERANGHTETKLETSYDSRNVSRCRLQIIKRVSRLKVCSSRDILLRARSRDPKKIVQISKC